MASMRDVIERWFDIQLFGKDKKYFSHSSSNVWGDEHGLYSWGRHFPLVYLVKDRKGFPELVILNGNWYSNSTSRHQGEVRAYIDARISLGETSVQRVIIPFDALDSAGVSKPSIKLVHATDDFWEVKDFSSYEAPEGLKRNTWYQHGEHVSAGFYEGTSIPKHVWRDFDNPVEVVYWSVGRNAVVRIEDINSPTGIRWEWETRRHWLGEALIKCDYRYYSDRGLKHGESGWKERRGVYFLSGFDHQEPSPSYFFAQLPRKAKPLWIHEAYESLKPESVKAAEMLGNSVRRQGDIFAIEVETVLKKELTKQGASHERMGSLLNTNHVATDVARLPDGTVFARGILWHQPVGRDPDHRRVRLGKNWHVIVKNTVPIVGGR